MTIRSVLQNSLLAGAALAAASPGFADVKAGVEAWSRGDYPRAINEWKGPADRGDADAQFNLGQAYKLGRGVPVDLAKAEDLFGKAAAHGHLQASDNYGLLLFQRGEHARAMPYIKAASDRGDPRAQYLLGISHFNGENVVKDWVRAYALVSLAQQSGLPQAAPALAQMDKYVPLEQRQQSVSLASELAGQAQATRQRQLAAVDLDAIVPSNNSAPPAASASSPAVAPAHSRAAASAQRAAATAAEAVSHESPRTAGADYARPKTAVATPSPRPSAPHVTPVQVAARSIAAAAPTPPAPPPPPAPAPAQSGGWRIQLGAFGVATNADAMWDKVKARPELAGHAKVVVPAGKVTKLQAVGFASEADARVACTRLTAAGFPCLTARN